MVDQGGMLLLRVLESVNHDVFTAFEGGEALVAVVYEAFYMLR